MVRTVIGNDLDLALELRDELKLRGAVRDAASERVLRQQINQLYSARWGVYRNWNNDWVLWALLIPLGGSSGLLILERSASLFGSGW